jgi:hypothetical protein
MRYKPMITVQAASVVTLAFAGCRWLEKVDFLDPWAALQLEVELVAPGVGGPYPADEFTFKLTNRGKKTITVDLVTLCGRPDYLELEQAAIPNRELASEASTRATVRVRNIAGTPMQTESTVAVLIGFHRDAKHAAVGQVQVTADNRMAQTADWSMTLQILPEKTTEAGILSYLLPKSPEP